MVKASIKSQRISVAATTANTMASTHSRVLDLGADGSLVLVRLLNIVAIS